MIKKLTLIFVIFFTVHTYSQEIKSYTWDEKPQFKEIPEEYKNQSSIVLFDKRWIHTRLGQSALLIFIAK